MSLTAKPMLETVPPEIRYHIFSYLPQEALYCLLLTSPALVEEAALLLYRRPEFRTMYRFAQFVTVVSRSRRYADMVLMFKLSDRKDDLINGLATWREWRYREVPLYAAAAPPKRICKPKTKAYTGSHPGINLLFNGTTRSSMPVGLVVHAVIACRNIREFKLDFEALTNDYLIKSPNYPSSTISGMVFGSDLARSWTRSSADVVSVEPNFLIRHLPSLQRLEEIQIHNAAWLTREDVELMLWDCRRLEKVDFRHSGKLMREQAFVISGGEGKWETPWAIQGDIKECMATLPPYGHSGVLLSSAKRRRGRSTEPVADLNSMTKVGNGAYPSRRRLKENLDKRREADGSFILTDDKTSGV